MRRVWALIGCGVVPFVLATAGCDPGRGQAVGGGATVPTGTAPSGVAGAGSGTGVAGATGAAGSGTATGAAGAGGGAPGGASGGGAGGTSTTAEPFGCNPLFDQAVLQDYAFDISADEWAKLDNEFRNRYTVVGPNTVTPPFHPVVFHSGGETVSNASIRLKGDSSWDETIALDGANAKMQFVIAFDQIDPKGNFHGVSKITLDMPRGDGSFLDERLAFNVLPTFLGRPAPCASSAKLTINGAYYGAYANEEHVSKSYLKRVFPEAPNGDLFKGGYKPETNTMAPNTAKLNTFWAAHDIGAMSPLVDMEWSVTEWAAEALINDVDGYYGGDHNFYLYDYPGTGYRWLVCDADSAFDIFGDVTQHPIYWWIAPRTEHYAPAQHYAIVMGDPTWRGHYIDAIRTLLGKWDTAKIQGWVDAWSAQIAAAAAADPHKAATTDPVRGTARMRQEIALRPAYLKKFLGCEDGTGDVTDADGDGAPWCNDCDDANAGAHPGAAEICGNGIDDDCNGFVDDGC